MLRYLTPHRLAGGVILKLTYGYEVQDGEDPFVNLIEGANANFNAATVPGAFPVDFFPIMKMLPEWLPGMSFLKTAAEWAVDTAKMVEVPYSWTQKQIVRIVLFPRFCRVLTALRRQGLPYRLLSPLAWKTRLLCPTTSSGISNLLQALCTAVSLSSLSK